MNGFSFNEFIKIIIFILVVNFGFALVTYLFVTDKDCKGLAKAVGLSRFITLFYFGITTFTTVGYGDIHASSLRFKIFMSVYMIVSMSIAVSYLSHLS